MTAPRTPTDVLKDARRRDSHQKRARVFAAVDEIKHTDTPITFALIARAADVSTWLVYADGVREYIEAARDYQAAQPHRQQLAGTRASEASLRTDLELARQDNRTLRAEIARLTQALRDHLGQQLDHHNTADLRIRIEELLATNREVLTANAELAEDNHKLQDQLAEAQDDLIAVRASLRQMIRDTTDQMEPT
jgi:DNA anti-recombination protein RmuC